MTAERVVRVTGKGRRWWLTGHPWIYRDDVVAGEAAAAGDLVTVLDGQDRFLGRAMYSAASRITLRFVTRTEQAVGMPFWQTRLQQAIAYRRRVAPRVDAHRLIFAEADGFPGLIADSYVGHLVLQINHPFWERRLAELVGLLTMELAPPSITLRNDSDVRLLEGLTQGVETVAGELPERLWVQEGSVRFRVDVLRGQKTGMFLDQRENRQEAARWATGRVLDCFTYQGGFALHAAAGAAEVTAVDSSAVSLEMAQENARLNGIDNVTWVQANCFDFLKEAAATGQRYDFIILDPPAFAKGRADRPGATKGYREINRRALQLLKPGGILISCSCSYNLGEADFGGIIQEAAREARREMRLMERRSAAKDHPARLPWPESLYLKCFYFLVNES